LQHSGYSKAEIPDPRWWDGHPPSNGCWDGTPLIPCFYMFFTMVPQEEKSAKADAQAALQASR
jgi:hypothetical protein